MTGAPPTVPVDESVAEITARLREWIGLKIPGIVWIRYVSESSREIVLDRLSFANAIERIDFAPPVPAEASVWLEEQLANVGARETSPAVSVQFSPLFDLGNEGLRASFLSLNLRRESIARMPLVQLWWIPASLARRAEAEALDLVSWFQIRLTLSETQPESSLNGFSQAEAISSASQSRRSLKSLQEAVERQRQLATFDPESYSAPLAAALVALGERYRITQRLGEAEAAYQEALVIRRALAAASPESYLPAVAATLNDLGLLYSDTQRKGEAEALYQEALAIGRSLADASPSAYLPDVATTLNRLGLLYSDTQRTQEAEKFYREALAIRSTFAEAIPEAYLPDVGATLNNLANLYSDTQRIREAETLYREALAILNSLAEARPEAHLPDVAGTLNNLANLYRATQRPIEAETLYREALAIRRSLAEADPDTYLRGIAMTLNNIAILYRDTQRPREAKQAIAEARAILEPLWLQNAKFHGNLFARIEIVAANIEAADKPEDACRHARQALAAAYDPLIKQVAQELIGQYCPPSCTQ